MTLRVSALRFILALSAMVAVALAALPTAQSHPQLVDGDGIVRVKSAYGFDDTVTRLKADIAAKGIMFFSSIDQSALGAAAGIDIPRSMLLIFGNPPLGVQFLTFNPSAGLDWPVRLLVTQDQSNQVWAVYTDFAWIARRHKINDREAAFEKASGVIASITSSIAAK